jgi:hypothetical protein
VVARLDLCHWMRAKDPRRAAARPARPCRARASAPFRHRRLLDFGEQGFEAQQRIGREIGRGDLGERDALLLGQLERGDQAEPVDDAVGHLGGDDLGRSRCASIASAKRACIAAGRRRGASGANQRIGGERPSPRSPPEARACRG